MGRTVGLILTKEELQAAKQSPPAPAEKKTPKKKAPKESEPNGGQDH